jgi:hypothetical protein
MARARWSSTGCARPGSRPHTQIAAAAAVSRSASARVIGAGTTPVARRFVTTASASANAISSAHVRSDASRRVQSGWGIPSSSTVSSAARTTARASRRRPITSRWACGEVIVPAFRAVTPWESPLHSPHDAGRAPRAARSAAGVRYARRLLTAVVCNSLNRCHPRFRSRAPCRAHRSAFPAIRCWR